MALGPVIGLDIGTQQIKFVEMRPTKSGLTVTSLGVGATPFGVLQNNIITDPQLMGQTIRQLLKESGATAKRVIGTVAGQSAVVIRIIEVPKMTELELKETMKWEVERHVPFAPSETVIDYHLLPSLDPQNDSNPNMEVLLAVAQQDIVNNYIDTVYAAKLDPVAIDIEPLAAARAIIEVDGGWPVVRPQPDPLALAAGFQYRRFKHRDLNLYRWTALFPPRTAFGWRQLDTGRRGNAWLPARSGRTDQSGKRRSPA